ncbi:hypothetical protein KKF55_03615 [Patescibacteria group bacterium]|nr:hypothetical protein [Patescibacteria group bacterium]
MVALTCLRKTTENAGGSKEKALVLASLASLEVCKLNNLIPNEANEANAANEANEANAANEANEANAANEANEANAAISYLPKEPT